jgi:hypothetical protein
MRAFALEFVVPYTANPESMCFVVSIERPVHELDTILIDWTSTLHSKIVGWTYIIDRLY